MLQSRPQPSNCGAVEPVSRSSRSSSGSSGSRRSSRRQQRQGSTHLDRVEAQAVQRADVALVVNVPAARGLRLGRAAAAVVVEAHLDALRVPVVHQPLHVRERLVVDRRRAVQVVLRLVDALAAALPALVQPDGAVPQVAERDFARPALDGAVLGGERVDGGVHHRLVVLGVVGVPRAPAARRRLRQPVPAGLEGGAGALAPARHGAAVRAGCG